MLRYKMIAPLELDDDELARRQLRYERLAGGSAAVTLVNLPGGPRRLDSAGDIERSAELVGQEIGRTDPERFDAVVPDCVLDPCVGELADTPVPLHGILRLAAGTLHSLGAAIATVTRNRAIGDELRRKLALYGLEGSSVGSHVLDVDFCLIADDRGWAAAMAPVVDAARQTGATHVLNGCSAVDVVPVGGGPCVVDPTRLALAVLAAAAESRAVAGVPSPERAG